MMPAVRSYTLDKLEMLPNSLGRHINGANLDFLDIFNSSPVNTAC